MRLFSVNIGLLGFAERFGFYRLQKIKIQKNVFLYEKITGKMCYKYIEKYPKNVLHCFNQK